MVHLSDLDWKRPGEQVIDDFKKGDMVRAVVLDVDVEKERISLGVKQLQGDPFAEPGDIKKGAVVTCEVIDVKEGGLDVKIVGTDLETFVKRSELARDRSEQRPERFAVGQKVDARVTQFDRKARKVQVSIKALEVAEEKEAIAQYGSSDSGATLGDILGTALKRATEKPEESDGRRSDRPAVVGPERAPQASRPQRASVDPAALTIGPGCARSGRGSIGQEPIMSLDADHIVDRRRMRRKLTFWRVAGRGAGGRRRGRRCICAGAAHAPHSALGLHRAHQDPGTDPRRPRPRRGAGPAWPLVGQSGDRAYRQPRRHHGRAPSSFTMR